MSLELHVCFLNGLMTLLFLPLQLCVKVLSVLTGLKSISVIAALSCVAGLNPVQVQAHSAHVQQQDTPAPVSVVQRILDSQPPKQPGTTKSTLHWQTLGMPVLKDCFS